MSTGEVPKWEMLYPAPHLFHLTPPPTHFISSYIKMINVFPFFHSHYMCNDSDLYIDTR